MNRYIDSEKLKDEITRIYNEHPVHPTERYEDGVDDGYHGCCDEIIFIIDSLQQEQSESDIEKEIDEYIERNFHVRYDETLENGNDSLTTFDFCEIARHFAEWGATHLNVRKEE